MLPLLNDALERLAAAFFSWWVGDDDDWPDMVPA
jgi:hypothetical protein